MEMEDLYEYIDLLNLNTMELENEDFVHDIANEIETEGNEIQATRGKSLQG